ncbi:MAG: hypothetical protein VX899_25555 [Myxococcota bacterium]|nr:hypothetical protein [Myxococcota bacterium]
MVALILLGCVHSYQGLIQVEGEQVTLQEPEGQRHELVLDSGSQALRALDDCTVSVTGKGTRRVSVQEWEVLAAQDGSIPFVGVLALDGSRLVLLPAGGGRYVLVGEGADALRGAVGDRVMVVGVAVGDHEVRVMGFTLLGAGF